MFLKNYLNGLYSDNVYLIHQTTDRLMIQMPEEKLYMDKESVYKIITEDIGKKKLGV